MSKRLITLDFFGFVGICNAADAEDGASAPNRRGGHLPTKVSDEVTRYVT